MRGNGAARSMPASAKIAVDAGLDELEHEFLRRERDLDVHLRELGLAVGPQVLVAEALHDLEVAVEARDHQDLLEDLRRLRQRVELARRARGWARGSRGRPRACSSRGSASRPRRSPARRSTAAWPARRGGAAPGSAASARGADRGSGTAAASPRSRARRRRSGRAAGVASLRTRISRASTSTSPGGQLGLMVSAERGSTVPITATTYSVCNACARSTMAGIVAGDHLREPVPVADVEEQQRAEVTDAVHPAEQDHVLPDVRRPQLAAGVGAVKVPEQIRHAHPVADRAADARWPGPAIRRVQARVAVRGPRSWRSALASRAPPRPRTRLLARPHVLDRHRSRPRARRRRARRPAARRGRRRT